MLKLCSIACGTSMFTLGLVGICVVKNLTWLSWSGFLFATVVGLGCIYDQVSKKKD